ncbi:MAG: glycosyltransferase family 2 protein, partial [Acidobacteria bacterium]
MRWVFWGAVALIAYTYVGYPLWLWLRCRLRPKPIQAGSIAPFVSVVMVVRNEERVLARKLDNLLSLEYPSQQMEIVVVSDGSTDRTEEILREYAKRPQLHAVMNQFSQGKASGLNDALSIAHGEIIVFTDARQTIETAGLQVLVNNFADPEVG